MKGTLKAVAVKYPKEAEVPFVCAKAKGVVAERLLDIAHENNIPIVNDSILTEVLSVQDIGNAIPEQTWEVMAKIFAFVLENDKNL